MRAKKEYIILTFSTTTAAMEAERRLTSGGIPGRLIPLPAEIDAGCGLAWRILPEDYRIHAPAITALGEIVESTWRLAL